MTPTQTRSGLFLAISALLFSGAAAAQDPAPAAGQRKDAAQATQLDSITVRSEYIPEPLLQTSEVASVVTREDLQRQGDGDAAAALSRVSGLSLSQGKFIYVRGLNERYSSALLNGSPLPSPEPLKRVIPLDLFPSSVLEGVTVQKTYSANYPGEFGGGVIDMKTVATPETPFLTISIGTGGNSEATFKDGITYYGGDWDYTGYDDGTRDMPGALKNAIATGKRVDSANFSNADLIRIGQSLVNAPLNLLQRTDSINPDFNAEISGGRTFETSWGKLGVVANVGFDNTWRNRLGVNQDGIVVDNRLVRLSDFGYQSTRNNATTNALLGVGAEWQRNKVTLTSLYVHDTLKQARSREGYSEAAGATVRDDYSEWFERELIDTQLAGEHTFGEFDDFKLEWRGAYASATRDAPYEKSIRYRRVDGLWMSDASQEQNYTRFSKVDDDVASFGVDGSWRLPTDRDATLSFGYSHLKNDRSSWQREFRLLALNGSLPYEVRQERTDFLLSDYNIAQGYLTLRETTGNQGAAAYDASLDVDALYLQLESDILPATLRGNVGVRWENGRQSVTPRDLFGGAPLAAPAPIKENYLLPAGTLTWLFGDNMQLRFGLSRTIARPQFRELSPLQYQDPDNDRLYVGNPYLTDSELTNFDLRYEWYFGTGEYLAIGGFYKDIDKPVEAITAEAGSTALQTYLNAPKATLYGAEVDFKKRLDLGWGSNKLFVGANYTWSSSEVQAKESDLVYPLQGFGQPVKATLLIRDGARMQGQADHLANLQFGIENDPAKFQATLLANYSSDSIAARGRPGQPDIQVDPGVQLDLVIRKGWMMWDREVTLGLEARNLLNNDYEEYQELGDSRLEVNRYDIGTTFQFSVSAKF